MIDTSKILTQADQYAFSLFDVNLIDFDTLEYDKNGIISLPLITSNLPKPNEPFDDEDTMTMITDAIDYGDMWFTYNAIDHKVEALVIEIHCIQKQIPCDVIIRLMEQTQHPEYDKYKQIYDKFIKSAYIQARTDKQKDIFYTIHRWWEKLIKGDIEFVDITNGDGTVYVARND